MTFYLRILLFIKSLNPQYLSENIYSKINQFNLSDILKSENKKNLSAIYQTQGIYFCFYEDSFRVFPDGETIFGILGDQDHQILQKENFRKNNKPLIFGRHSSQIFTVKFDGFSRLLAGHRRFVVEYKYDSQSKHIQMTHIYNNLNVGLICSLAMKNDIAIVGGGYLNGYVRLLDFKNKRMMKKKIKTAIRNIVSLKMVLYSKSKLLLTLTGELPEYSKIRSDAYILSLELDKSLFYISSQQSKLDLGFSKKFLDSSSTLYSKQKLEEKYKNCKKEKEQLKKEILLMTQNQQNLENNISKLEQKNKKKKEIIVNLKNNYFLIDFSSENIIKSNKKDKNTINKISHNPPNNIHFSDLQKYQYFSTRDSVTTNNKNEIMSQKIKFGKNN